MVTTEKQQLHYMPVMLEKNGDYALGRHGRRLYEALSLVGWSILHRGCGVYGLRNHKGEEQRFSLRGRGSGCLLELDRGGEMSGDQAHLDIALDQCDIGTIDGAEITLTVKGAKNVYILFPHFDLSMRKRKEVVIRLEALQRQWAEAHKAARVAGVID